jgi:hypothetical protein
VSDLVPNVYERGRAPAGGAVADSFLSAKLGLLIFSFHFLGQSIRSSTLPSESNNVESMGGSKMTLLPLAKTRVAEWQQERNVQHKSFRACLATSYWLDGLQPMLLLAVTIFHAC